jgi:hypothetical protein
MPTSNHKELFLIQEHKESGSADKAVRFGSLDTVRTGGQVGHLEAGHRQLTTTWTYPPDAPFRRLGALRSNRSLKWFVRRCRAQFSDTALRPSPQGGRTYDRSRRVVGSEPCWQTRRVPDASWRLTRVDAARVITLWCVMRSLWRVAIFVYIQTRSVFLSAHSQ